MDTAASSNWERSRSPTERQLVGWVLESSGRGTLGLVLTNLATTFLCTWVVIHPRVYKSERYALSHKLALFLKAILAPELIAVEGLQEWAQCRRMEDECAAVTGGQFKLIHAFYVSMLALRYRTPEGDRVIWPNQYAWLLQERIIRWEDHAAWGLSEDDIRDKSKADSVAKLIALVQASWFVAECIMRVAHSLPLSQLESTTLGYIPLFVITYFFWWDKPKDIRSPSIVNLPDMSPEQRQAFESKAVSNKFDYEGVKGRMTYWNIWYLTPRVFEKEEEDKVIEEARAKAAEKAAKAAEKAARRATDRTTESRREDSKARASHDIVTTEDAVPNPDNLQIEMRSEIVLAHWDPGLYGSRIWPLICLFGVSFPALHLVSWNTVFPTDVEMWLWRVSAFVSIFSMLVFMHFKKVVLRWRGILTIISIASPGLYFVSRVSMMVEGFIALRAEEPSIYDTYQVSNYWLHLL